MEMETPNQESIQSEQIKSYVDAAVDFGLKLEADYVIARGIDRTTNQIRFSQNKIDINKEWQIHLLELFTVVEGNKVAVGEFSPTSEENVRERVEAQVKFAKKMAPSPLFQSIEKQISNYSQIDRLYDPKIVDYREKKLNQLVLSESQVHSFSVIITFILTVLRVLRVNTQHLFII